MSGRGGKAGGGDKRTQFFAAVEKEDLKALRYFMLHSGLEVGSLHDDEERTPIQICAALNLHKGLLVILDVLRQKRELVDAIEVMNEDGLTPLHIAAQKGHVKSVDYLIYYGANQKKLTPEGKTARDLAADAKRKDVVQYFDDMNAPEVEIQGEGGESADADGLTSTQRSRLKKKQLAEDAKKAMEAAIQAASDASKGDDDISSGIVNNGESNVVADLTTNTASLSIDASSRLPALPKGVAAQWPDLIAALNDKKRDFKADRIADASSSLPSSGDSSTTVVSGPLGGEGDPIDPALYRFSLLNRLELHVPGWTRMNPLIGHLSSLQTLIVSGNSLQALPETLDYLTDLKFLDVSKNSISVLPECLGKLKHIEVLELSENKISSLLPLAPLTTLLTLNANGNQISDISMLNFEGLSRLETLSLARNKLIELPNEIGQLQQLAILNISDNEVVELPSGMSDLKEKKIRDLRILPNPIADKKVLKVLNKDRVTEVVKELWKLLAADTGKKGKKGK
jgi:Leucine-rich repeat (LRR) protein